MMSYIRSKDSVLYYEEHGSGPPLILLPGLLGTIESHWSRFIPDFANHFHVIAVDLRGHGRTDNPGDQLRLYSLVADLYALYEALEIDSARICGYSLGGYIGLAFGIQHPGRVEALLMHGTKFFWERDAVNAARAELEPEEILQRAPAWAAQLSSDHVAAIPPDGWKNLTLSAREFIQTLPSEGLSESALKLANFPVMVSVGDKDETVPQTEASRLADALPYGMLHIFPNTRHPIAKTDKKIFLEIAYSFFNVRFDESARY